MNVYDFDKTIYQRDSTVDFYFYCLKKHPLMMVEFFSLAFAGIKYKLKLLSKTQAKEVFYRFLKHIPDVDKEIDNFWNIHITDIKKWYLVQKRDDDVIISASPEFLLRPICDKLDIKYLIASRIDKKTGITTGGNCYGEEKVVRFQQADYYGKVDEFYSDSYSDDPLAKLASKSFLVKGDNLFDW